MSGCFNPDCLSPGAEETIVVKATASGIVPQDGMRPDRETAFDVIHLYWQPEIHSCGLAQRDPASWHCKIPNRT
jgi:hypothetical protein